MGNGQVEFTGRASQFTGWANAQPVNLLFFSLHHPYCNMYNVYQGINHRSKEIKTAELIFPTFFPNIFYIVTGASWNLQLDLQPSHCINSITKSFKFLFESYPATRDPLFYNQPITLHALLEQIPSQK